MKNKALGKGLGALIVDRGVGRDQVLHQIPIHRIDPSSSQPRRQFEDDALAGLAQSIKQHGVLLPVIVRPKGIRYELIAGERRWRAAREAGLEAIPAIIKNIETPEAFELALIENLQRKDLNPIEEASGYNFLIQEYQWTQEQVAEKVGKDRATVANLLRLLKLPLQIQKLVLSGRISTGHAKALLSVRSSEHMILLAELCAENDWSVRILEMKIRQIAGSTGNKDNPRIPKIDPDTESALTSIRNRFQTKIQLKQTRSGKGFIKLEYYSPDDLERILELLSGGF